MSLNLRHLACFILLLGFIALAPPTRAQDLDDVTITGRVLDTNNAAIPGAKVTATLEATGATRTVTADAEGRYRLIELKPGTYTLTVIAGGFAENKFSNIVTISGQNVQLDVPLSPQGATVEIEISDDTAPPVDTTRTVVGGTVNQQQIEELPNVSRNPLDLIFTLGGTAEESLSTRDLAEDRNANPRVTPTEQGSFSLSGGASYSNNITIDGLDNNDDRSASDRFQPSLESIAEVQVITNQFSAEYGRASGGRVNLRTRSGTNKFRGRAFMFFRDDNLNANSWYNNSRGIARLPLTEYNPGFTLSGPVTIPHLYKGKNRTFFAVAYEFNKLEDTTLIDSYVPVVGNSRFTLPTTTGGTPTCDGNPPVPTMTMPTTPCQGTAPTAAFVSPYTFTLPTPNQTHTLTARIDHKLFNNNEATFGFQYGRKANRRTSGVSTTRIEDALQVRNNNTRAFNFTDNQVFGAKSVNQFRFQWSRYTPSYQTDNPNDPVVLITYRNPILNATQTLIAGNSTASSLQNFSDSRQETRYQFQDSLSYLVGGHTLKGGLDLQRVNSQAISLADATGTFNFNSVLTYQNNTLSRYRQNFGTASDVVNTYWGAFINDEFRLRPNFTVSYGVRYEKETAVTDNNNFGPRLGIAWDPFKKGKGVIRFGAGIFYNRVLLRTVGDFIQNSNGNLFQFDTNNIGNGAGDTRRFNVLARIAQQFPNGYASVADVRSAVTSANCAFTGLPAVACPTTLGFSTNTGNSSNPLRTVDPNLKIPESYQFNIGFEREIAKGLVFEANYTWNKTAHLWRESNPNTPVLPAGFADWTAYLLANPFRFTNFNTTVRTYQFYLGSNTDGSGTATAQGGATACTVATTTSINCFVNLNTVNTTTTAPSTTTAVNNTDSGNSVGTPLGIALAAIARFRPNQNLDETARVASIGNTFYQGLVLELRSRFRTFGAGFGSTFRAVYTLSSLKDDGLNNTSNAEINGDFSREWARSLQDRRQRFALSGTFNTPWWLGKLKFSPLFRLGSSAPINLGYGFDRNLDDLSTDRLNFSGNISDLKWRRPGSPFPTALAAQFSLQPIGSKSGNIPRNAGRGPGLYAFDMGVTREWKFGERFKIRPNLEFNNILNAAVFSFGSEFIDFTALSATPTATQLSNAQNLLVPTRTYRPRAIRVGLRFDF